MERAESSRRAAEDYADGGVQERGAEEDCGCGVPDCDECGGPVERLEWGAQGGDQREAAESVLLHSLGGLGEVGVGGAVVPSRDDDFAAGQQGGAEVLESGSDDDSRV